MRFHPTIVLHAVGQAVADEAYHVIRLKRELRRCTERNRQRQRKTQSPEIRKEQTGVSIHESQNVRKRTGITGKIIVFAIRRTPQRGEAGTFPITSPWVLPAA
jgi:hypothetical protein